MSLQLPSDLTSTIQSFLASGQYENEIDVVRVALASLKRDKDLAAIQEGIEDEAAGRLMPARTVLEQTKQRLNRDSS